MKFIPRSDWTSIFPRPTTVGDNHVGLEYFTSKPTEIEFCFPQKDIIYAHRNPTTELDKLLQEGTNGTGISDLNYNYAIAPNVKGVYVVRGAMTKCSGTGSFRVLMLNGIHEKPTDLLIENQKLAIQMLSAEPGSLNVAPKPVLRLGDNHVHVFNLIEWLTEQGYYVGRNDAVYGPIVWHAMRRYQNDHDVLELNGTYDEWTYLTTEQATTREYIPVGNIQKSADFGATTSSVLGL